MFISGYANRENDFYCLNHDFRASSGARNSKNRSFFNSLSQITKFLVLFFQLIWYALKQLFTSVSVKVVDNYPTASQLGKHHWTKKWIYIIFAQRKGVANISLLQSKPVANVVKSTFATTFTLMCKYGSKCGLYHVCYRFALEQRYAWNTFALCKFNVNPFFRPVHRALFTATSQAIVKYKYVNFLNIIVY